MNTNYQVIKTEDELRKAVESLSQQQTIGLDTETTELDPYYGRLRLIQLATSSGVYVVDLDSFRNGDPKQATALRSLRDLLAAPRPIKILHNAKFDAKFIKHTLGTDLGGIFDTLLASQLVSAMTSRSGTTRHRNFSIFERSCRQDGAFEQLELRASEAQLEYGPDAAVLVLLERN